MRNKKKSYIRAGLNYDILSNDYYQEAFQYYPIYERHIPNEATEIILQKHKTIDQRVSGKTIMRDLNALRKYGFMSGAGDDATSIDFHHMPDWKLSDFVLLALNANPNKVKPKNKGEND